MSEPCRPFAGPPEPPLNCNINMSKKLNLDIDCDPGFDGGLSQEFLMTIYSTKDNEMVINKTYPVPLFSVEGLRHNKSAVYRVHIRSFNSKGKSDEIILPDIVLDGEVSELNGPITRAAHEGKSDKKVKPGNTIAELQEHDTKNEPESPLVSILCGVLSAIIIVFVVIAVTMRIRCGRMSAETTWRKECSSESSFEISPNSPDLLVKNVEGIVSIVNYFEPPIALAERFSCK